MTYARFIDWPESIMFCQNMIVNGPINMHQKMFYVLLPRLRLVRHRSGDNYVLIEHVYVWPIDGSSNATIATN